MSKIIVEKPTAEKLANLGVTRWTTWSKLVTFPAGMSCVWEVKKVLRKHYQLV